MVNGAFPDKYFYLFGIVLYKQVNGRSVRTSSNGLSSLWEQPEEKTKNAKRTLSRKYFIL
ncbi:hypothetical protein D7D25_03725 [Proteiniphilum sp. X52]|nr:hypothetical protein D7D25_03725 [Proteiniphilum sp. X52]